eukprot:5676627-Pleurochrysis_carterae.AAC.1
MVALPIAALLVDTLIRLAAVGVLALSAVATRLAAEGWRTWILDVALLSGDDQRLFTKNALERDCDDDALAHGHLPLQCRPEVRH